MTKDGAFPDDGISDWFWNLITKANGDQTRLRELLQDLSSEDLTRFEDEFRWASSAFQDKPYTDYMDADISSDRVDDIANFVVSQGREFYTDVRKNPSLVPPTIDQRDPRILSAVADQVHWEKFGREMDFGENHEFQPYE